MSIADSVDMLMRGAAGGHPPLDPRQWKQVKARVAWVRETIEALKEAQRHMDERCLAAVDTVPDDEFERIFEEEQAKVCAILDQLHAVRDQDRWPAELYFGGI